MNEKIIKTIISKKINVLGVLIILILLSSCNSERIVYSINKNYTGVCAVFITEDSSNNKFVEFNKDGLSHISKIDMYKEFIFIENNTKIEVKSIGSKIEVKDSHRYIFQLTNNTINSKCVDSNIEVITFFIGTNKDFLNWNSTDDELEYLNKQGIDWCSYYKRLP